jgi:multidrug resistance efflux pump
MREFTAEVRWSKVGRDRRLAVERAEMQLESQRRSMEIDDLDRLVKALDREAGLAKQQEQLEELQHDLELMVVHAPASGMLLHGGLAQFHPGAGATRFQHSSDGYFRRPLFTVADPGSLAVVLHVKESEFATLDLDQPVSVSAVAWPDATASGRLAVLDFGMPAYARVGADTIIGMVQLEYPLMVPDLKPGVGIKVGCGTR